MSVENTPASDIPAQATSELPNGAAAAPVDGGVAGNEQQPGEPAPQNAEGQGETPDHRKASYRFGTLTQERNKAREEAAYWKGVAEASRQSQPETRQPMPQAPAVDPDPKPDPNQYGGAWSNEYLEAVAAWSGRQEVRKLDQQRQAKSKEDARKANEDAAFEANAKRFHQTVQAAEAAGYAEGQQLLRQMDRDERQDLIDDITRCRNGAAVAEWLARPKPDEQAEQYRKSVLRLPEHERRFALVELDHYLGTVLKKPAQQTTPAQKPTPAPSNASPAPAPTPAPTVGNSGGRPINLETCSMEEYARFRSA